MTRLSSYLSLSLNYTNHSVRATAITILGNSFQDTDVASFSGHRSLNALGIYKRVSNNTKKQMSDVLSSAVSIKRTSTDLSDNNIGHKECCISYGIHSNSVPNYAYPNLVSPPMLSPQSDSNLAPLHSDLPQAYYNQSDDLPTLTPITEEDWNNLSKACDAVENNVIQNNSLAQQQKIIKENKIIILNNCSGTFNF
jgi:hypothetical protein